jgi:hypothetical protein
MRRIAAERGWRLGEAEQYLDADLPADKKAGLYRGCALMFRLRVLQQCGTIRDVGALARRPLTAGDKHLLDLAGQVEEALQGEGDPPTARLHGPAGGSPGARPRGRSAPSP